MGSAQPLTRESKRASIRRCLMAPRIPLGTYGLTDSAWMPGGVFAGWALAKTKPYALCRNCCALQEGGIVDGN